MCYPLCPEHVLPPHPTPPLSDITFSRKQFYVPGPFFLSLYMYFLLHSICSAGLSSPVYLSVSSTVLFLHLDYSPTHLQGCPLYFPQPLLEWHLSFAYHSHFPSARHFISPHWLIVPRPQDHFLTRCLLITWLTVKAVDPINRPLTCKS